MRQDDAAVGSSLRSSSSASTAVMSTSTIASALSTNHRTGRRRVDGGEGPAREVLGVGEEQRRVVAVDEQPRHRRGVGVVVDVVHPGQAGHVAQDGVVRPGHPAQQVEDREADGDEHPVEHPDHHHADAWSRPRSGARCAGTRAIRRNSATSISRSGGVDDDRAQRGDRERGEHRTEEQHGDAVAAAVTRPVSWVRLPSGVADRGAAAAAADRQPVHQPGAEVGRAEGDQLRVGVDRGRRAGWRTRARSGCCRSTPTNATPRPPGQRDELGAARSGQRRARQPGGIVADHGDPCSLEIEQRRPPAAPTMPISATGARGSAARQQHRQQRGRRPPASAPARWSRCRTNDRARSSELVRRRRDRRSACRAG